MVVFDVGDVLGAVEVSDDKEGEVKATAAVRSHKTKHNAKLNLFFLRILFFLTLNIFRLYLVSFASC